MLELEVKQMIIDVLQLEDIAPDDIDSIDAVDLAVKLKQLTGRRLQPEVFKTIRTIDDVVSALDTLIEEQAV